MSDSIVDFIKKDAQKSNYCLAAISISDFSPVDNTKNSEVLVNAVGGLFVKGTFLPKPVFLKKVPRTKARRSFKVPTKAVKGRQWLDWRVS